MESISREVNDVVVKVNVENGKPEVTGLRVMITGSMGTHITSFFKGETPFCDCIAFTKYKKCTHVAVCDIVKYSLNALLPLAEIDKVFEKVKQQT